MDLSFAPFDRAVALTVLPGDLAALMVGVARRQAASPTAVAQAHLCVAQEPALFQPRHGAFNAAMAAVARDWRQS